MLLSDFSLLSLRNFDVIPVSGGVILRAISLRFPSGVFFVAVSRAFIYAGSVTP